MNNNSLFNFEGHEVEVINFNGMGLFNPYDVGECLGLTPKTVANHMSMFNSNQVIKLTNSMISDSHLTGNRNLNNRGENFLTEPGLYRLVFRSNKPSAERFQNWVYETVLPEIRMYGGYIPGNSGPEVIGNGMTVMDNKVGLKDNTEYIKAYIEKNEKEIREREPQFQFINRYNPVRFVVLHNYLGWDVYNQISMERLYEVMYKICFIFDNNNITYLNPAKVYRLSKYKDEILLTPEGFKELYYYFSDSKLKYRFKDVDYEELRIKGERADLEYKSFQDIANNINE